ncbi:MAG: polymer-forming cytoskeletal protein, partial [Burkholderiales bacterium]
LEATTLVIEGEVNGPAIVADRVEIGASARVRSNVEARLVAIADGAFFEGAVRMAEPGSPVTFTEKRGPR